MRITYKRLEYRRYAVIIDGKQTQMTVKARYIAFLGGDTWYATDGPIEATARTRGKAVENLLKRKNLARAKGVTL